MMTYTIYIYKEGSIKMLTLMTPPGTRILFATATA